MNDPNVGTDYSFEDREEEPPADDCEGHVHCSTAPEYESFPLLMRLHVLVYQRNRLVYSTDHDPDDLKELYAVGIGLDPLSPTIHINFHDKPHH